MEANSFIQSLLAAMSIEDREEDTPFQIDTDNLDATLSDIPSQLTPL